MDKKEILLRILPIGVLIATVGFVAVGENVHVEGEYPVYDEAVMPEPSIIPGRGFVTKLK